MVKSDPTIFVVDDDPVYRKLLQGILNSARFHVETFASAEKFLEARGFAAVERSVPVPLVFDSGSAGRPIVPFSRPGCLLLDVQMPGIDGLRLQQHLVEQGIFVPIIMLTGHADVATACAAFRTGAVDFVEKPVDRTQLLSSITKALSNDEKFRREYDQRARVQQRLAKLGDRERQVLELLVADKTIKEIAAELGSSAHTIRNQRRKILEKMGVESDVALVSMVQLARSELSPWR
jgi:RNA polymerase sigma factor (sigma-70 family)